MPTQQKTELDAILSVMNQSLPRSKAVLSTILLNNVQAALSDRSTITIRIVDRAKLQPGTETLDEITLDRNGDGQIAIAATLSVSEMVLRHIEKFTQEPNGEFSFVGTHEFDVPWESNYGGWRSNRTVAEYKVSVDKNGRTTYEVISSKNYTD